MQIRRFKASVYQVLAMVLCINFILAPTAGSLGADNDFYSLNNITFYNPEDNTCSTAIGGSFGTLTGGSNAEKIWGFLIQQGLTDYQAAGVMGNISAESGYVPTRRQGTTDLWNSLYNSNAWGLVQWDGGRRYTSPSGGILGSLRAQAPHLEKYTALEYDTVRNPGAVIPEADLNELLLFELNYMVQESKSRTVSRAVAGQGYGVHGANEWETLKLQQSIMDAVVFWHNNFEVSADSPNRVIQSRGSKAQEAYNSFASGVTTPQATEDEAVAGDPSNSLYCEPSGSSGSGSGSGAAIQSGDFSSAVLQYAHPEWHAPNFTQMMTAYAGAVSRAQTEGRYVGGGRYPGVDCGGFVTTLLVDSGFEPNYNSGQGNTVIQKQWLDANWRVVGNGASINTADLQPGDVAMRPGHTFVYVGSIEGFGSNLASASYGGTSSSPAWRAPMAGKESLTDSRVTWYRKG